MSQERKMYTIYGDSGHAWCRVKIAELERLGIAEHITTYSYRKGQSAYLEEDKDLTTFVQAKREADEQFGFIEKHTDKRSPIRSYPDYFVD